MTISRSISVRQALNLQIEPSAYASSISLVSSTHAPPSSSSTGLSGGRGATESPHILTNPVKVICSVLCLYDFVAEEENALAFRRNEILEVVKKETTGWWAAMRRRGAIVGWIPEAFVKPLSSVMAERLREVREEMRVYEYQAEQLYNSAPTSKLSLIDSGAHHSLSLVCSQNTTPGHRPSPKYLPRTAPRDALSGRSQGKVNGSLLNTQSYGPRKKSLPPPPPSPITPMPHPPPQSAPLYFDKPVPPLPHESLEGRARASSLSSRSLRRRPLLVNDNTALSRLSTLIETNNTRDIDKFANPDVSGSFQALPERSRSNFRHGGDGHGHRNLQSSFQILDKPWYILPAHADELELDQTGQVRSGSLLGLIERLTSTIVFSHPNGRDPFCSVFLMTYRTFTTSEELFDLLLDRFSMIRPDNLNELEVEDWKRRCLLPTQRHVLDIFTLWLEEHRLLEEDLHIAQRLPDFIKHVATPRLPTEGQALLQIIERLTSADPMRAPMGLIPKKPLKTKDHKNDILRVDATLLADQLFLYEYNLYEKITAKECLSYVNKQVGAEIKNLATFCSTYDKLGNWVKMSILNQEIISKRAHTIDHWIKVAERCHANSNFSSMSAIISALSSVVITRLSLTWVHVGRKSHLDALLKHNEPDGGFAGYRNLLSHVQKITPCVPFITMYLTDLLRVREQYDDKDDRISFVQRQRWHDSISLLLKFKHRAAQHVYDEYITTFVQSHLKEADDTDDQNWVWSKSEEIQHTELAHADVRKGLEQAGF